MDVSVIVVSWNVWSWLAPCLRSIRQALGRLEGEIIVVDNASTDGTPERVREAFPEVRLLINPANRGFPAANNQGMAVARGRYFFLLNPDTVVLDQAIEELVTFADAHPDVGVVGPQLLNPDGSVQSSRRRFPTFWTALFESTWWQPWAPRSILAHYYVLDRPDHEIQEVDWVTGAAMLVRREVVERVGPMDEGFFMYAEELDWCRRIRQAGWRVFYYPPAKVIHYGGRSSDQVPALQHLAFQRSKIRYFRKHHGTWAAAALRAFLIAQYLWQIGVEGSKALLGHKPAMRRERMRIYMRVVQGLLSIPFITQARSDGI
ncbi:glycosyltransferase family 2 protein [Thermoflexus hugenholtzii]|uniref:Glycosyltransferase, GT2 family n=1 Tax=Thermoflexus hugenholtzii JAD2 TaxID=877466 RepID=A0A212RCA5_9CHLR|nr:glycosyltransferase family 2 protein [Thermoflexus hugenholtzii]SNB69685.1 Glycosyltransferase, GT2 family [Thermoflexus hugenholtzii JAD2]